MSRGFVHDDRDFDQLIGVVSRATGIAEALVEKDYWVTHVLWALHQTGLEIGFKGGTSLSKGFGIIERFSEDLDLMIHPGQVSDLPPVTSWKSANKGAVRARHAFYDALPGVMSVPGVQVVLNEASKGKRARSAEYRAIYPSHRLADLAPSMLPFVKLEIGQARVVPNLTRALSSFIHDHLEGHGQLGDFLDNRPHAVKCVHPLVTLLEKLDAMARRYCREPLQPSSFVRHYEDVAQIIDAASTLPACGMELAALVSEMIATGDLTRSPSPDEPALRLSDPVKREAIQRAYAEIAPMFWGPRMGLDDARASIMRWLEGLKGG